MESAFKALFALLTIAPLRIWLPARDLAQRPGLRPARDVGEPLGLRISAEPSARAQAEGSVEALGTKAQSSHLPRRRCTAL
jgi:hypothetical protein